jgi:hypothetical protein
MLLPEMCLSPKTAYTDNIIEQTNSFKYLGCDVSRYKMNVELEERVQKLDGCIKKIFWEAHEEGAKINNTQCDCETSPTV